MLMRGLLQTKIVFEGECHLTASHLVSIVRPTLQQAAFIEVSLDSVLSQS